MPPSVNLGFLLNAASRGHRDWHQSSMMSRPPGCIQVTSHRRRRHAVIWDPITSVPSWHMSHRASRHGTLCGVCCEGSDCAHCAALRFVRGTHPPLVASPVACTSRPSLHPHRSGAPLFRSLISSLCWLSGCSTAAIRSSRKLGHQMLERPSPSQPVSLFHPRDACAAMTSAKLF